MFRFTKKAKTPDKYDDVDWHTDQDDAARLVSHIAFMYIWLIRNRYMEDESEQQPEGLLSKHTLSPSEFLDKYADGKLVSSGIKPAVIDFLNSFYDLRYLAAIESNNELDLKRVGGEPPYNIADSWDNADKVCLWLDDQYSKWVQRKD